MILPPPQFARRSRDDEPGLPIWLNLALVCILLASAGLLTWALIWSVSP